MSSGAIWPTNYFWARLHSKPAPENGGSHRALKTNTKCSVGTSVLCLTQPNLRVNIRRHEPPTSLGSAHITGYCQNAFHDLNEVNLPTWLTDWQDKDNSRLRTIYNSWKRDSLSRVCIIITLYLSISNHRTPTAIQPNNKKTWLMHLNFFFVFSLYTLYVQTKNNRNHHQPIATASLVQYW